MANKRRVVLTSSIVIIAIIVVSSFAAMEASKLPSTSMASKKPFYVGITYCGSSVIEAQQLIDTVKNYTNLFVLQSGPLMYDVSASEEICDYAVQSGLYIIISGSTNSLGNYLNTILSIAPERWGSNFLGLYFNDEPAGHMLDSPYILLNDKNTSVSISKNSDVTISFGNQSGMGLNTISTQYEFGIVSGIITKTTTLSTIISHGSIPTVTNLTVNGTPVIPDQTVYYPNGTITYSTDTTLTYQPNGQVFDENGQVITNQGNISQFESYQQVWNLNPLLNDTDAANFYINNLQSTLSSIGNQSYVKLFTSDYALYWFDYQGGYNTVFAELFGQQTDAQTLGLVRGAADMQDKSWGVMIEPASQSPLNLQTGDQIYNELQQAYEDGAEYGVVFNYAPNSNNMSGLLQDEQFNAIQRFWTDVVQNPKVTNNVKGQDALVLPSDYGSSLRSPTDSVWGIWQPDSSHQVWNAVQTSLAKYGSKLDIVYNNPNFSTAGKYQRIIYWSQTID
jgi:hypothetical protein